MWGNREWAIPKSVDIADFVYKLELLCKRLNWSRAKLAQQAGIDKSLASRWLTGGSRPTGNSLMRLNEVFARALPGFSAATWDLASSAFAQKFGMEGASATARMVFGAHTAFARFSEAIDDLAPIFCGTYDVWTSDMTNGGGIVHRYIRIIRKDDGLRVQGGNLHTNYEGDCFVIDRRLYAVVESPAFASPSMILVSGPYTRHPTLMSGFILTEMRAIGSGWIAAVPIVMKFREPLSGDAAVDEPTWQALRTKTSTITGDKEIRRHVPAKVASLIKSLAGARQPDGTTDRLPIIRPFN